MAGLVERIRGVSGVTPDIVLERNQKLVVRASDEEMALAEAWYTNLIGEQRFSSSVTKITPARAKVILSHNKENRPISLLNTRVLMEDIKEGRWELNGEPIIIATGGFLNDGQHRLLAVLLTGVAINTVLTYGVDRSTRFSLDQGISRSTGQLLQMKGVEHGKRAAAVASMMLQYEEAGKIASNRNMAGTTVSRTSALSYYNKHAEEIDAAVKFVGLKNASKFGGPAFLAAMYAIIRRRYPNHVGKFFRDFLDGENLKEGTPVHYLRQRFLEWRTGYSRATAKLSRNEHRGELILKAWNLYAADPNQRVTKLQIMGNEWPEIV